MTHFDEIHEALKLAIQNNKPLAAQKLLEFYIKHAKDLIRVSRKLQIKKKGVQ